MWWVLLAISIATSSSNPVSRDQIPESPPLVWKLLAKLLENFLEPIDRELPMDVCATFCALPQPVKTGMAVTACGGAAVFSKSWTGLVCPVSLMSWVPAMDRSICNSLCDIGKDSLEKVPRALFDFTGLYVHPSTVAALSGLLYMTLGNQGADLYASKKSIRKVKGDIPCGPAGSGAVLIEVFFFDDEDKKEPRTVRKQFESCTQENKALTHWVSHIVESDRTNAPSGRFGSWPEKNDYYGKYDVDKFYKTSNQEDLQKKLAPGLFQFRSEDNPSATLVLTRGHLAPDGDFLTPEQQAATYTFINAAPQWKKINGANWGQLETSVRDLAVKAGEDLKVWTGTYGILNLLSKDNTLVEIFLDNTNPNRIPVPRYFWKIVVQDGLGIAVVVANNPHSPEDDICTDISPLYKDELSWMTPALLNQLKFRDNRDITQGKVTVCEVKDLAAVIPGFPISQEQAQTMDVLQGAQQIKDAMSAKKEEEKKQEEDEDQGFFDFFD